MSVSADRRRQNVLQNAYQTGRVSVKDLVAELDVSEATIRRDLKVLAAEGELELVYGGAALPRIIDFSFRSKAVRNSDAKRIIGRLAAELVQDNDQIFMDSGTTCFQMIPHLKDKKNLVIVTNSTRLAMEIDSSGLRVITLGGQYRPERMDTVGPLATRTLESLRGYVTFMGTDGLCKDFGPTASDIESAHLHAVVVANARETVLVADYSKFLKPSLYKIVDFEAIARIVTDRRPSDDWMRFLAGKKIEVIYPEESRQAGETRL